MNPAVGAAVATAVAAVWLAHPRRLEDLRAAAPRAGPEPEREDALHRYRLVVSLLAGLVPYVVLGGWVGVAAALVAGPAVWRVLGRRESAVERRRREEVARMLPHAVDLLAVTMASGAAPGVAVSVVGSALEGPLRDELLLLERGLRLGKDPVRVWRETSRRPGLEALGRCMVRATDSGASVAEAMHRLAEDLSRAARAEAESRAHQVGVRAAAPLGLCLLPAFVLIAVVPLVGSVVVGLVTR